MLFFLGKKKVVQTFTTDNGHTTTLSNQPGLLTTFTISSKHNEVYLIQTESILALKQH